ncbi:MAG: acyl-protein synthase [Oligoflexia bacterium]|nr:acyl-protein synthase [Oligoflexia bacterium]
MSNYVSSYIQKLCAIEDPYKDYYSSEMELLFKQAMAENLELHRRALPFFDELLKNSSCQSDCQSGRYNGNLEKIPYILANFFKRHSLLSIPKEEVFMHLTSSGTTGQKSQMFFDRWSIESAQKMVDRIFKYYGWITPNNPCNYLLFAYEPQVDKTLGTAYTDNYLCKYAPTKRVTHALKHIGNGEYRFDWSGSIHAIAEYAHEGIPVRILGFPAFLYFMLKRMKELNSPRYQLPSESLVFLGGGLKGHSNETISKEELYASIEEWLGIPNSRIRDGFGSVEHCIPYIECEHHHFHIPVWSRVLIRDLKTLEPLPSGQAGFLQLISPYITSVPAMSVLMSDLASWYPATACACQVGTPYFVIHGRAGISKNRSCAIAAAEMLQHE